MVVTEVLHGCYGRVTDALRERYIVVTEAGSLRAAAKILLA